jgi:hypothetical protein
VQQCLFPGELLTSEAIRNGFGTCLHVARFQWQFRSRPINMVVFTLASGLRPPPAARRARRRRAAATMAESKVPQ